MHITYTCPPIYFISLIDDLQYIIQNKTVSVVLRLYCIGNNDKKNLFMYRYEMFSSVLDPWLVGSSNAEAVDTEG